MLQSKVQKAICVIKGEKNISGIVVFSQLSTSNSTSIYGLINGLPKGYHGIHIHEYGDMSECCNTLGSQ